MPNANIASRDANYVPTLLGVSSADGTTPVTLYADPTTHRLLTSPAGGAAPTDATYVVLSANATLTDERILTGTANQITITDNGAGSTVVLSLPQSIATSSTPTFASMTLTAASSLTLGTASTNAGAIILKNATNANTITIKSGVTTGATVLTLPVDDGTPSQVLQTDGSGVLSWATVSASPGGSDTQVQYNNAGAFGGITGATTNGTVMTLTTPVLNGTATGTGVSQTASASTLAQRNASSNLFANNHLDNSTSTVSAGGTTVLTAASSRYQVLTGASSQTYQLPDATTLSVGTWFVFNNNSSGSLIITNAGASTLYTAPAGGYVTCGPTDISTANGVWDFHPSPPATVTWSSGATGLVMNSALTTTPTVLAGASSATAPSFIPQRTASTTGFGGDGTNLFATIAGTAYLKVAAASISPNANDGTALGTTALMFSDLFLASGGVINFNNGNVTLTHSTGTLTLAGTLAATSPDITTSLTTPSTTFSLVNATATTVNFAGAATTMAVGASTALITVGGNIIHSSNAITASGNAATVPITHRLNTVTNNSAATLTITMTTTSAVDGQLSMVRILDASAAAQTITWVNTENSLNSVPTTSNGSTTLPLTVGFQYNNATSKWRCIAVS